MEWVEIAVVVGGGACVGIVGATIGLGGGVILVPILTLGIGVPMPTAVAVSVFVVLANSAAVSAGKVSKGLVCMPLSVFLEFGAVFCGMLGAWLTLRLDPTLLMKIFGIVAAFISLLMVFTDTEENSEEVGDSDAGRIAGQYFDARLGRDVRYEVKNLPALILASGSAGLLSGLLGIGGGVVTVPSLVMLGRLPLKVATATSTYVMGVAAAGSALILFHQADPAIAGYSILGVVFGAKVGNRLSSVLPAAKLRMALAIVLLITGLRMILR